ncbi:5950_t:CDS:2, partial [Acaulospora morrowiae]
SLSQHISQSHPYINDKASQTDPDEQADASIYNLPDYSSSYDSYMDESSIIYGDEVMSDSGLDSSMLTENNYDKNSMTYK